MAFEYASFEFAKKVAEALGLGDRGVRRIVIDIEVDNAAKVYVEEYLSKESVDALAATVAEGRERIEVISADEVSIRQIPGPFVAYYPAGGIMTANDVRQKRRSFWSRLKRFFTG